LVKDLQKKVKIEDIVSLNKWEAIARIGTEIVRFTTPPPLRIPPNNFREQIIAESRKKYCKPAHEVRQWIQQRGRRWESPFVSLTPIMPKKTDDGIEDFIYDEF
jgi:hypothetical protein